MPYFPDYNALFVHIPRTSGSAMERLFQLGCHWPQRYEDKLYGLLERDGKRIHLQHLTALQILSQGFMTQEQFKAAYTFSMVRNPFSRAISHYRHLRGEMACSTFEVFLAQAREMGLEARSRTELHSHPVNHLLPQHHFVFNASGESLLDFVGRYERRDEDLQVIAKGMGFDLSNLWLVHPARAPGENLPLWRRAKRTVGRLSALQSLRTKMRRAKNLKENHRLYTPASAEMVREIYARDFEVFGYSLDCPYGRP